MIDYLFDILTPLDFKIHTTKQYWDKLLVKHPELEGKLELVQKALVQPDEIRKSRSDEFIFLFCTGMEKYTLCAVARKTGVDGFLITAYITDKIKEGELVWRK
jgi:hypothetical protein